MKKTLLTSLFCGALIASSLANFENNNQQAPIINNPLNRMVIVNDGGGGGGSSIPNHYGFNRKQFLENSTQYQPYNRVGSCGYIALMQMLSFYDTFYNDSIIPDQYDRSNKSAKTLTDAVRYSPGVEPIASSDYPCGSKKDTTNPYNSSLYRDFCYDRQSFCLQSHLTILYNQDQDTDNATDFECSASPWDYDDILEKFYGEDKVVVSEYDEDDYSQSELKQIIKNFIDGGDPVAVAIEKPSSSGIHGRHAVVAYDYSGDTIYANFGWGSGSSKRSLFDNSSSSYGYNKILYVTALNFNKMGPKHSDNYVVNGENYCGCCGYRTEYLNDTKDHLAASLAGTTKKVTWTRPIDGRAEIVDLHVVNSAGFEILKKEGIEYNEYIFTEEEWKTIVLFAGSRVGFYVTGYADPTHFLWWVTGYNTIKSTITYYKSISDTPSYDYSCIFSYTNLPPTLSVNSSSAFTIHKIQINSAMTRTFNGASIIYIVNANTGKVYLGLSHGGSRILRAKFDAGTYYMYALNTSAVTVS